MKYKLINNKTKEEHLCDKVTIDGFDYYVSDKQPFLDCFICDVLDKRIWKVTNQHSLHAYFKQNCENWGVIIVTNNPNIDIPKVVDEVEELANDYAIIDDKHEKYKCKTDFKVGYNKSQETHPFSEEDMIEFAKFAKSYRSSSNVSIAFKVWKEQQPKTVYYE